MVYKMNESIIVIQAEATSPNRTNVVFWSHDRGTAKLKFKLMKNNLPLPIPDGTTVPIRLMFKSATAEGGYGKHDYLATVEDPVNGIVSIVLEDNILGYVGTVEGSVYIDFPNDRSLDTAGRFTFYIKRSPIDDSTPELEDYYFNGFSQTIDKIEKILADGKLEIEKKIAESETQIDAKLKDTNDKITKANQDVATLNTNIDKANDRIDQTNQQIGDLGKLKKMYSNSIDFGGYDYSGNPNLFVNKLESSDFNKGSHGSLTDDKGKLHFTSDGTGSIDMFTRVNTPAIVSGKTYTISARLRFDEGTTGDINKLRLVYRKTLSGNVLLEANNTSMTIDDVGKEITIKGTSNVAYEITDLERFYISVSFSQNGKINGGFKLSHIKIEAGSTATPYQPNLLDAPYYLSKVALGKNIANKGTTFPIKSSGLNIYVGDTKEDLMIGQTYTITLKGTKPASQTFAAFNRWDVKFGDLKPVEGLADVWSLTFTPTKLVPDFPKNFRIYQSPEATAGACQIDWLKIEKGDTRTPNISQFKYFGEGLKDSNNPNDYSWDITPEYTEKGLNDSVSLTEPETVLGLKNFEDGLQIAGKEVATVPEDTGWVNLTAINGHSWNKQGQIRRIGKLVMFRGSLKGSTLSTQDFCTIPEGFRPSNPTDNYEYQFLLPPQSSNTLDNGGMAYIRPNGVCGLPSFRGTVNLFLAPIQYYID
ncbi:BppU family phage baseplate upper protein [Enterococcus faecium]|uniref:BppU family phage baseplate upper protein n=1 Tax=Enterococcus faecium TaxID=1352 RepID=UPI00115A6F97|nr:BppU family phage baseplate upper protein [Enterococcus faecium]EGP4922210.1 BppU family phage baseplate upper protein [Enterococcus faecium]